MTQQIYQKVKTYLKQKDLMLIIMDSFSHDKLCSFIANIGLEFPGTRVSSISKGELAFILGEEAWIHPEVVDALAVYLNELNRSEIEKVKTNSIWEIKGLITNVEEIYFNKKIGSTLWALLCDERKDVNRLIKEYIKRFMKLADKKGDMPQLSKDIREEIENYIHQLEENEQLVKKLKEENRRLGDKINRMGERIHELQKQNGQLINEKSGLRKENERLQNNIEVLKREISQLKEKLQTAPKLKLVSQIHQLERDNKKLQYELEKARGISREESQEYIHENKELRERLNELQIMTYRLEEELSRERQNLADIKQERETRAVGMAAEGVLHRGKRLGIFIDGQNIYHSAKVYYGKKLDHGKLISAITRDRHLVKGIYYLIEQPNVDYEKFINMLKALGYTVKSRNLIRRPDGLLKVSWDIGIATDIINSVEKNNLDIVALVACDSDFVDLIRLLKTKGVKVEIAGFEQNTVPELKNIADEFYPLEDDLMLVTV